MVLEIVDSGGGIEDGELDIFTGIGLQSYWDFRSEYLYEHVNPLNGEIHLKVILLVSYDDLYQNGRSYQEE